MYGHPIYNHTKEGTHIHKPWEWERINGRKGRRTTREGSSELVHNTFYTSVQSPKMCSEEVGKVLVWDADFRVSMTLLLAQLS